MHGKGFKIHWLSLFISKEKCQGDVRKELGQLVCLSSLLWIHVTYHNYVGAESADVAKSTIWPRLVKRQLLRAKILYCKSDFKHML